MDDLFAMETLPTEEPQQQLPKCAENLVLTESNSYEDPALLKDTRVLANLLHRQDFLTCSQKADYFKTIQTEVKPHMRKIVSDWMLEVCEEQQCQSEVFHLAINYMDRFLSKVNIKKNQFQLIGAISMFLASKFKETCPLPADHLVIYTDYSTTTREITQWEMLVLDVLEWDLSAVTPYSILDHILRSIKFDPVFNAETVRKHAETFVALAATEHTFCHKSPAVVAVACLGAALRGLNSQGLEAMLSNLQLSSGVQTSVIRECMEQIEVSISLSMSGSSYQPNSTTGAATTTATTTTPAPAATQTIPKIIPQQSSGYFGSSASTTPTDLMDVVSACVY